MYLSSLRSQIEAMGGELAVVARFPDGAIKIKESQAPGGDVRGHPTPSRPPVRTGKIFCHPQCFPDCLGELKRATAIGMRSPMQFEKSWDAAQLLKAA